MIANASLAERSPSYAGYRSQDSELFSCYFISPYGGGLSTCSNQQLAQRLESTSFPHGSSTRMDLRWPRLATASAARTRRPARRRCANPLQRTYLCPDLLKNSRQREGRPAAWNPARHRFEPDQPRAPMPRRRPNASPASDRNWTTRNSTNPHAANEHGEPSTCPPPHTEPSTSGSEKPPTGSDSPASPDKRLLARSSSCF